MAKELLAREMNIKPDEIQELKPYEVYIGIGKKSHKVLTFQGPDTSPYNPIPSVKTQEFDFLGDGWISY